jgi:iron complex transport system substrate-binding protein
MKTVFLALFALCSTLAQAAVSVVDDSGRQVVLARPAQRVISMAPHVTELLFAAGGGVTHHRRHELQRLPARGAQDSR